MLAISQNPSPPTQTPTICAIGAATTAAPKARWLLLAHQPPTRPSNLRVRMWRRLQQLGALAVKQAVYALPDTPASREDFEWLKTEIDAAGGDAAVFAAVSVDAWSDDELIEAFRRARQEAYGELEKEIARILQRRDVAASRRPAAYAAARKMLPSLRQRLAAIERVDFFSAAGRDRVALLLAQLDERSAAKGVPAVATGRDGRAARPSPGTQWITRPRPGVDRMSSAWLIRRFIDPKARFGFVKDRAGIAKDAIGFDMVGAAFTHRGDACTFETLCTAFGIADPAVAALAKLVHDLDLKDARFGAPDAATVGKIIDGFRMAHEDDDALLEHGVALFEALYLATSSAVGASGPRALARAKKDPRSRRR